MFSLFVSFSSIYVSADEEPTVLLSPAVSTEISTEFSTSDDNNIIIEQPHNIVASGGDTVSFNVKVSDSSLIQSYLWVYTPDGGVTWNTASTLTGYETDTLTLIVNRYRATWKYKCVIALNDGNTLETRVASIISPEQQTEPVSEPVSEPLSETDKSLRTIKILVFLLAQIFFFFVLFMFLR